MIKSFIALLFFLSLRGFAAEEMHTFYVKPKSVLTSLEDNQNYLFEKGFFAKVKLVNPKDQVYYVYDDYQQARYTIESHRLEPVEDDLNMLPAFNPKKNYRPQNFFRQNDSTFPYDTQFSLHFDSFQVSKLNEIYSDKITSVSSTRYEFKASYLSSLPVKFGLAINYQSAYWQNDLETIRLSILSFGPSLKYSFVNKDDFQLLAALAGEVAPIYQGKSENDSEKYSALLFDVGIEAAWKLDWGTLALGSHYRQHQIKIESSTRPNLDIDSKIYSLSSIGFMVGYKLEWSL